MNERQAEELISTVKSLTSYVGGIAFVIWVTAIFHGCEFLLNIR